MLNPGDGLLINLESPDVLTYPDGSGLASSFVVNSDQIKNNLWNVDYHDYEFNGTITSKVIIEGIPAGSPGDFLGVFVDGECRGVAEARSNPFNDEYVFLLMAYSNKAQGEEMKLSYYDAQKDIVYENIQTVMFEDNMVKGDAIHSYVVSYDSETAPTSYKLKAAYPNPFNPSTNIDFSLVEEGNVNIAVYNLQGRLVTELVNDFKSVGDHSVVWNAVNVPTGIYFIQMYINGFSSTQKVMLMK
mgnify:FL=1